MQKFLWLNFIFLFCFQFVQAHSSDYPARWWQYVDPKTAPKWEILPQEALNGEVILSKRNELGLFSNFAATPILFKGLSYASIEGLWQSMKYPENNTDPRMNPKVSWPHTRLEVSKMSGKKAKKAGKIANKNMKILGINWISFEGQRLKYKTSHTKEHFEIIQAAQWAKVIQHPKIKTLLLKTGDLILKPDHHQKPNAPPAYKYFNIYMQIRNELNSLY